MILGKSQMIFKKDYRSELRGVVLYVESIFPTLDDGVTSRNRYIVDAHFRLMTSTQLKLLLGRCHCEHVDVARSVLVKRH